MEVPNVILVIGITMTFFAVHKEVDGRTDVRGSLRLSGLSEREGLWTSREPSKERICVAGAGGHTGHASRFNVAYAQAGRYFHGQKSISVHNSYAFPFINYDFCYKKRIKTRYLFSNVNLLLLGIAASCLTSRRNIVTLVANVSRMVCEVKKAIPPLRS